MLKDIPLFSCLGDKDLNYLESVAVKKTYGKNAVLISEGDRSDQLFLVKSGKLKVTITDDDGREIVVSLLGPRDYFGEIALIDGQSRSANIVTTERAEVWTIGKDDFHRVLKSNPDLMFSLLKVLARKVRIATAKLESLAFDDVYSRIVKLLMQLAKPVNNQWVIEERLTHQEIANMVGASREMVSRILKPLTTGGFLSMDRKRITIRRKLPSSF